MRNFIITPGILLSFHRFIKTLPKPLFDKIQKKNFSDMASRLLILAKNESEQKAPNLIVYYKNHK